MQGTFLSLLHSDLLKEVDKALFCYTVDWEPFITPGEGDDIEAVFKYPWCTLKIGIPSIRLVNGQVTVVTLQQEFMYFFLLRPTCNYWSFECEAHSTASEFIHILKSWLDLKPEKEEFGLMNYHVHYAFRLSEGEMRVSCYEGWNTGGTIAVSADIGIVIVEKLVAYLEAWDKKMSELYK